LKRLQNLDLAQVFVRVFMHFWVTSAAPCLFSDLV